MIARHPRTLPSVLFFAVLLAGVTAAPLASAEAGTSGATADPFRGADAQTSPFAPSVSFTEPEDSQMPRLLLQQHEEQLQSDLHVMPWTFFAATASSDPNSSDLHGGFLAEFGVEFGTPIFHVGGVHWLVTFAPAIGGQIYEVGNNDSEGAYHFGLNALMGVAVANPAGTNVFQFGFMARAELAHRNLEYGTGESILGLEGIGSLSAGMFVRYSFLLGWDLAGSAAMFILHDVTAGQREWMVGVDLGGLIIAALLGALSDSD